MTPEQKTMLAGHLRRHIAAAAQDLAEAIDKSNQLRASLAASEGDERTARERIACYQAALAPLGVPDPVKDGAMAEFLAGLAPRDWTHGSGRYGK